MSKVTQGGQSEVATNPLSGDSGAKVSTDVINRILSFPTEKQVWIRWSKMTNKECPNVSGVFRKGVGVPRLVLFLSRRFSPGVFPPVPEVSPSPVPLRGTAF